MVQVSTEVSIGNILEISQSSLIPNKRSAVYRRLFPHAAKYDLRLVALNLREYRGSTPYSPSDLAALGSGDTQQQLSMLQARGVEIATFLVSFIRKENIPLPSNSEDYNHTRGGGLAVLGWSWGNCITIAFLAQAARLPDSERNLLDAYLRGFILFGLFFLPIMM